MTDLSANDMPLPIIRVSGTSGDIVWANDACKEWLSRSLKSLRTLALADLFINPEKIMTAGERARQDYSPVTLHDHALKHDLCAEHYADLTVFEHDGDIHLFIYAKINHPVRSHTGSQAASAMGRMLAHEIKNPLAGIHGAAQLLRDDVDTEEGQALIDLISSETDRIRRLSDRMESMGESDPKNAKQINVHEILTRARRIIETSCGPDIRFKESYDPSLPHIMGDEDTLMQAILNLIKNAAEAIQSQGEGGDIRIETSFRSGVTRRVALDKAPIQLPVEICISSVYFNHLLPTNLRVRD